MSRISISTSGVGRFLPLILALAALFILASAAQAQTEQQTYTPVDSQVVVADTSAGSAGAGGGAAASGAAGGAYVGLLPSTGGPLLPLIGLGAVALGATGLVARRRYGRQ